jgi:hypothetical protein
LEFPIASRAAADERPAKLDRKILSAGTNRLFESRRIDSTSKSFFAESAKSVVERATSWHPYFCPIVSSILSRQHAILSAKLSAYADESLTVAF